MGNVADCKVSWMYAGWKIIDGDSFAWKKIANILVEEVSGGDVKKLWGRLGRGKLSSGPGYQ